MRLIVILLIVAAYGWWHFSGTDWTQYAPGATVAAPPVQTATNRPAWVYKDYSITPLAHFAMDARVIATRSYSDQGAALAPYDVVMGWQTMSDPAILAQLDIAQTMRRWIWHTKQPSWPAPRTLIETGAANMHLVPANDTVRRQLQTVRPADTVRLEGYLIQANGAGGMRWVSSLTRHDTGDGSCELIWVENLTVISKS